MSKREKDTGDLDLETFIDLFDTALSSDNPAVKRALKNLLMIATLVDSDLAPEKRVKGPLRKLVEELRDTNRRIDWLQQNQTPTTITTTPYTSPYRPGYQIPPAIGTGTTPWPGTIFNTTGDTYTLKNITSIDDQYLGSQSTMNDLLDQKYQEVLNRLEEK